MILYKSLFALFYQIGAGQWPPAFDADVHKGVVGVTLLEAIFVLSVSNLIAAHSGDRLALPHWWLWVFFLGLICLNYYVLVVLKIGVDFLPEFRRYPKRKRTTLYATASGLVVIVGILFFYSAAAFHRAFLPA